MIQTVRYERDSKFFCFNGKRSKCFCMTYTQNNTENLWLLCLDQTKVKWVSKWVGLTSNLVHNRYFRSFQGQFFLLKPFGPQEALISDSLALSQATAEAARPWAWGTMCRMVCLFTPAYVGTKLYCLVTKSLSCYSVAGIRNEQTRTSKNIT